MVVLDASMALSWLISRADAAEAALSQVALAEVQVSGALVPALWYSEVANTLLIFERAKSLSVLDSDNFLTGLALLTITQDETPGALLQPRLVDLGRSRHLTAYDAAYLELALRTASTLATFDRKLAAAARSAGVRIFGDTP